MEKRDFLVHDVRRYLEPGPIVLVTSHWRGRSNIMTLGWHTELQVPLARCRARQSLQFLSSRS
jgi:hypothetical protein